MLGLLVTVLIGAAAVLAWLGRIASVMRWFERKAAGGGRLDYY